MTSKKQLFVWIIAIFSARTFIFHRTIAYIWSFQVLVIVMALRSIHYQEALRVAIFYKDLKIVLRLSAVSAIIALNCYVVCGVCDDAFFRASTRTDFNDYRI